MHVHSFLRLQRHYSPGVHDKKKSLVKTVMKFKNTKSTTFNWGGGRERESMLLQHSKARPHISAAASAVIENTGSEVIPHLTIAWIWQ